MRTPDHLVVDHAAAELLAGGPDPLHRALRLLLRDAAPVGVLPPCNSNRASTNVREDFTIRPSEREIFANTNALHVMMMMMMCETYTCAVQLFPGGLVAEGALVRPLLGDSLQLLTPHLHTEGPVKDN